MDAKLAVQNLLNFGGGRNDSTATISTSFRKLVSTTVISSVAGFNTAGQIMNRGEADAEADRLLAYLQGNPQKATSLNDAKTFLPYAAFLDTPGLAEAWAERQLCVDEYQRWKLAELRLGEVILNPTLGDNSPLKEEARRAEYRAEASAGLAGNCNPTEDVRQYKWMADLGATVPLYRFYSEERTNNYYTTNKESVNNIDGGSSYRYVGIACRVFTRNVGGVTWLREYWYNQGDDHRYDTDQARGVQGSNYVYNGEVGYLYANNGVNAIDDRYLEPVYLFYNDEVKDHLITTDPQRESFGSPDGGDGYTFQGTMGYAVSADFELELAPAF